MTTHAHTLIPTPMPAYLRIPGEYVPLFVRSKRIKRYGIPTCACGIAVCPTHGGVLAERWGNTAKWAFRLFLVCVDGCTSAGEVV